MPGTANLDPADLACLRTLARRGASAESDPAGVRVQVVRAGRRSETTLLAAARLERLRASGLVRSDGGWRITRKGLAALRRRLSAGPSPSHRVPPERERPARPRCAEAESPLAWLRTRRDSTGAPMISAVEFAAGERLRADFHFAGLGPCVTANWDLGNPAGRAQAGGERLSERAHDARERVNRALAAVGPELSGLLLDVCCFLRGIGEVERRAGWPERSAKIVLRIALRQLARHYGLSSGDSVPGPSTPEGPRVG